MAKVHFIGAGQMTEGDYSRVIGATVRAAGGRDLAGGYRRRANRGFALPLSVVGRRWLKRGLFAGAGDPSAGRSGGGGEPRARPAKRLDDGGFF